MDANKNSHSPIVTKTSCSCRFCLFKKYSWRILLLVLAVGVFWAIKNYAANKKDLVAVAQPEMLMRVLVGEVKIDDVPVYINALGSVTPSKSVIVRSQINGVLTKVLIEPGQMVDADTLIAEIDPRPYQAQLAQIEGQLTRDQALLRNAQLDLERYQKLVKQDSISQQTLDTQIALVKQYEGNVESDLGQIEAVRLNLDYCRIKSPIHGRTSLHLTDPGNLVNTSDQSGIVTINTTRPINIVFSIPEDQLPQVAKKINERQELQVNIQDRSQNTLLTLAKLTTMDNQIDPGTGTIKLQAVAANENDILFPNQFVNVQLLINTLEQVITVPTQAIQHSINGNFVYLLKEDNTVSMQLVKVGVSHDNKTVINADLHPGQKVVIQGADQLKDGMKVMVLQAKSDNGSAI